MTDLIAIRRELARLHDQVAYIERTLSAIKSSIHVVEQHLFTEPQPAPTGSKFDDIVHSNGARLFSDRMKSGDVPTKHPNRTDASAFDPLVDKIADKLEQAKVEVVKTPEPIAAEPLIETEEWKHTLDLLLNGKENIFCTGGAGVGKTTMLEQVVAKYQGNMMIVAPTGIAALRAGGSTIHREMGFDIDPKDKDDIHRLTDAKKRRKFEVLDTLLLDEASMIRADLMDAVEIFLRKNRGIDKPFGGVRIILFGDLFQLSPVVKRKDTHLVKWLEGRYGTALPYVFHAECLRDNQLKICELTTVFRQKDKAFSDVLNAIRKGTVTPEQMALINTKVQPGFKPPADELWLTLTTTNDSADAANKAMLRALPGLPKTFDALLTGEFKEWPTEAHLELKVGASVMAIRNDNTGHHWVNGTLAKVTNLNPLWIKTDAGEYQMGTETWESVEYQYDEKTKKLGKKVLGSFEQIPLRHASAITIHKSQGQTYQRVIVDMAGGAFSDGQTYTALSRATALDGMILRKPILDSDVKVNSEVLNFMSGKAIARPLTATQLTLMQE